jgi:hypothetical protein
MQAFHDQSALYGGGVISGEFWAAMLYQAEFVRSAPKIVLFAQNHFS